MRYILREGKNHQGEYQHEELEPKVLNLTKPNQTKN